jgi:hypothetical protein
MKLFASILIAGLLCATASAQTLRGLMYNTTNGHVVAATNVVWTNSFTFSTNAVADSVRTNLSLGLSALTNTSNVTMMRALAGSTNTNQPFSGVLVVSELGDFADTVAITISNGIIVSVVP